MDHSSPPPGQRKKNLTQQLVAEFARRIREGEIQSGEKLPTEQVITRENGVSRTVVREAMARLQAEGLVETRHGIGTFVVDASAPRSALADTPPQATGSPQDAMAILELRLSLEPEAAALAARRRSAEQLASIEQALRHLQDCAVRGADTVEADHEFHRSIALCTDNSFFIDVMNQLGSSILPRMGVGFGNQPIAPDSPDPVAQTREQEQIYSAIALQDPEAARAAMRLHLRNGLLRVSGKH